MSQNSPEQDLFEGIERHDLDAIASALSSGADPNRTQPQAPHWTPLHAVIEELEYGGPLEALRLLLGRGAAVNGWDGKHNSTPLLMAVFRSQFEAVRLLLGAGADPNVTGAEGDSPLRWAVEQDDREMAELLLRSGAVRSIDSFGGPEGMTALGKAASSLNLPMLRLLLSAGADPEALDTDHRPARFHLPARETNPGLWDEAHELLRRSPSTKDAS